MRILPFLLGSLLLQVSVPADTFWLSDPKQHENAPEGSLPEVIRGVLIAESDEGYHVRIVGGELILPKASVYKIEKDDLSIDAIVQMEKDQAQALADANAERREMLAAERRAREVRALEASLRSVRGEAVEAAAAPAVVPAPVVIEPQPFDPVVGVVPPAAATMTQPELLRELRLAWELTHDRSYLTLLRVVRRMR